jgi:hypothetical protein
VEDIVHTGTKDYASALRTIGQDLADLLPLYVEIQVRNGQFNVQGRGLTEQFPGTCSSIENFLHKAWNMLIRHDPEADIVQWQLCSAPFTRTYTPADISCRNKKGSSRRNRASDIPDIYSLGERLRVVGKIVDAKQADLIDVIKNLDNVSFQYRDGSGQIHLEEYAASELYRIQREYYANRKIPEPVCPTSGRDSKKTIAA